MTLPIVVVVAILALALLFFVTGWVRMDLTALLVVSALALTGLVTPTQAFAGFSNPAVITVAGMFVISAALARTGVANLLGRQVLRVAGTRETSVVVVVMATAGILSAVMNNIGVAAMMLPVVMDIARRIGSPPSKLLMPLALGSLMGGLLTLIGTPPNLLASEALREQGLRPFGLLDFTLPGGVILAVGILFVATVGLRLLPSRDPRGEAGRGGRDDLVHAFDLQERIFVLRIPERSRLAGTMLAGSRLGSALGLHVLALVRDGKPQLAPSPDTPLRGGDRLLVQGRPDLLNELRNGRHLELEDDVRVIERMVSVDIGLAEATVAEGSDLDGRTLLQYDFRRQLGLVVLAIRRGDTTRRTQLEQMAVQAGDCLLLHGSYRRLEEVQESRVLDAVQPLSPEEALQRFQLEDRFITFRVTPESLLVGRTLAQLRIGDAAGLTVLGIVRRGVTNLVPNPDEAFEAGDLLLIKAHPHDLAVLRGLQKLEIEREGEPPLDLLESDRVGLLEVVLAPRSSLVGKTPRQIGFRDKYGVSVLAIWRGDRAYRSNLRDMELRFGDAVLVFGPRDRLKLIAREPDFLVLSESVQEPPRIELAPLSVAILLAMLLPVLIGVLPIAVAVVLGSVAMVLSRCLSVEQAYRAIEWPALILIAGMLPLGTAMEQTGAARLLAESVVGTADALGPRGVLAGICLMTALGAQVMPSAALVVLMAPIALSTAADLGLSPHALMMGVALSAASLSSPVAHPANVLVMGPGGYRYVDYLRLGIPLTVLVLLIVIFIMPVFFPLVV
jgi:di/tricarboxylate transporter